MPPSDALIRFVEESLESDATAPELFAAAEAAGLDLSQLLDVLAEPFRCVAATKAWKVEEGLGDVIHQLAEYCGIDRASDVVSRTACLSDVDVGRRHADVEAWRRAYLAITSAAPLAEAYALVVAPEMSDERRQFLLHTVYDAYGLVEFARIAEQMPESHSRIVGERLAHGRSALSAFEELVGVVDDSVTMRAIERFWGVAPSFDGDRNAMVVRFLAQLSRLELRPLDRVVRFAEGRGEPAFWVPILRECGLKGAQAALHLMEAGWKAPAIAEQLARAGYDDDAILTALLENGVGTRRSITLLRAGGWSLERMVESLHHRDVLLPEVCAHLDDLRVPRLDQVALVVRHWDESVVEIVLGRDRSDRA